MLALIDFEGEIIYMRPGVVTARLVLFAETSISRLRKKSVGMEATIELHLHSHFPEKKGQ
jgi:hypothetical protein